MCNKGIRGTCTLYKKFKESLIVSDYTLTKCHSCLKAKKEKKKNTCNKIRTLFFRFLFLTPFMAALTSEKHPQVMFRTI